MTENRYDVVVVGGGAAGLSAAVTLGRSRRSVLVVDAGEPRNAPADGAHMLLGREGVPPLELLAEGRREAEGYGVRFLAARTIGARRTHDGFEVDLDRGGPVWARRLLLATGLVDVLPDVPGVRELWGRSVLHCPYCHGWEVRDRRIGVLGTGPKAVHQALLFRQLSEDVTLFAHTMPEPDEQSWGRLVARGIRVVTGRVSHLAVEDGALESVVLEDGHRFEVDAVTVAPVFVAQVDLYEQLGGAVAEHPMGTFVPTGAMGATEVPGVWAAGNVADLAAGVALSAGMGVAAAGSLNADLVMEEADLAVAARLPA